MKSVLTNLCLVSIHVCADESNYICVCHVTASHLVTVALNLPPFPPLFPSAHTISMAITALPPSPCLHLMSLPITMFDTGAATRRLGSWWVIVVRGMALGLIHTLGHTVTGLPVNRHKKVAVAAI